MVYRSFLTGRSLQSVETALQRAWVTLIEFYDPPEVTIRRRVAGVWTTVATLTPIRLRLSGRLEITGGPNEGATEIVNGGTMRIYDTVDLKRDDRFKIDTDTYVIGLIEADDNHGTQLVNFRVLEGA